MRFDLLDCILAKIIFIDVRSCYLYIYDVWSCYLYIYDVWSCYLYIYIYIYKYIYIYGHVIYIFMNDLTPSCLRLVKL